MVCPNCGETIKDNLLVCPHCKDPVSEPIPFKKRKSTVDAKYVELYEELVEEEKKDIDYMKIYRKEMTRSARSMNLQNEAADDVLSLFEEKEPSTKWSFLFWIYGGMGLVFGAVFVVSWLGVIVLPSLINERILSGAVLGFGLMCVVSFLLNKKKGIARLVVMVANLIMIAGVSIVMFL